MDDGRLPVISDVRLGLQRGAWQWALVKVRPRPAKRLIDGELSEEVIARLDRELGVINKLGFPNYFLIVWDFVRVAHERGIETTARGSGVGAIVCYALGMSHVCPLEYDLLFERFLNPERISMPDIDVDFCYEKRGQIIEYVARKYGRDGNL